MSHLLNVTIRCLHHCGRTRLEKLFSLKSLRIHHPTQLSHFGCVLSLSNSFFGIHFALLKWIFLKERLKRHRIKLIRALLHSKLRSGESRLILKRHALRGKKHLLSHSLITHLRLPLESLHVLLELIRTFSKMLTIIHKLLLSEMSRLILMLVLRQWRSIYLKIMFLPK